MKKIYNGQADRREVISEFVRLMRSDNASMFIGSGLSASCGLPSWKTLMAEPFKTIYGKEIGDDNNDYYDIADKYVQYMGSRVPLNNLLLNNIPQSEDVYHLSGNHKIIARLPLSRIWTTNWDMLIEKSMREQGKKVTVLSKDADFPQSLVEDVKLYKIHGCISNINDAIVTKTDIYTYYRKYEVMNSAFFSALAEETFLFLGFGFQDDNLRMIIGRLFANFSSNARQHFAVLIAPPSRDEAATYQFGVVMNDLAKFNIRVLPVQDHSEIPILLKDIEKMSLRNHVYIGGSLKINTLSRASDPQAYEFPITPFIKLDPDYKKADYENINMKKVRESIYDSLHLKKIQSRTRLIKDEYWYKDGRSILEAFLHDLGQQLMEKGKDIYSGYGEGICDNVVAGATKMFLSKQTDYYEIHNRVKVIPLPIRRDLKDFSSAFYRSGMLGACGFMIITRGSTYASDIKSGTFEEYNIARGLSSVLNGKQRKSINSINKVFNISYSEKFDYKLDEAIIRKAIASDRRDNFARKKWIERKLSTLIQEQSKIIYYKYHELIGIFRVLFNEEWKLVMRRLEKSKVDIAVFMSYYQSADTTMGDLLNSKLQIITKRLSDLILERAEMLYEQFDHLEVVQPTKRPASGPNKSSTNELLYSEIKETWELLREKPDGFGPKRRKERIIKILEATNALLASDRKYDIIYKLSSGFTSTEIAYTKTLLSAWSDMTRKEDPCHPYMESEETLKYLFRDYENMFIALVRKVLFTGSQQENGKNLPWEMRGIDHYFQTLCNRVKNVTNIQLRFQDLMDKANPTDEEIRFRLRLFLIQYSKDLSFLDCAENKETDALERFIDPSALEKYQNAKSQLNVLEQNLSKQKSTDRKINDQLSAFYSGLYDSIGELIMDNRDGTSPIYSRKYLLIYRIQLYKLLDVIADIKVGLHRIESDFIEEKLTREKQAAESLVKRLWGSERSSAQNPDAEESIADSSDNDEFIKYNPFMYNPNKIDSYIERQKQFLNYYEKNAEIHSKMLKIKSILNSLNEETKSWNGETLNDNKLSKFVEDSRPRYHELVALTKEIFEIDGRENNSFKSEPYRSPTVVIPIAFFEGMAKKIWEFERFRFELLLEGRNLRDSKRLKLMQDFHNLYFTDGLSAIQYLPREAVMEHQRIKDSLLRSVMAIIEEFQTVPDKPQYT